MKFANGTTLHAALPLYAGYDYPREWVVMVELDDHRGYVTARVASLDATTWTSGNYFTGPGPAMADAYVRAGILDLVAESVRALATSEE